MPKNGVFPSRQADQSNYFKATAPYLLANQARLQISADNAAALEEALSKWNHIYPLSINTDTRTRTITMQKQAAIPAFMDLLRNIYADFPESVLTPEDRNTLNLKKRKSNYQKVPPPSTTPVGRVSTSDRLQHSVFFSDNDAARRGRPAGVHGSEIWVKTGGAEPVDTIELHFLGMATKSPFIAHFNGADAGKPAYYMLRWVNRRGQPGPWSETVMATITG